MRLSVTQIRILILVLNLFLTAMIGLGAYRGIFVPMKMDELSKLIPDPGQLRPGEDIPETGSTIAALIESSKWFRDPTPAVAPPDVSDAEKKDPGSVPETLANGEPVLDPGPLGEEFEYVTWIGNPANPQTVRGVIQKKEAGALVGGRTMPRQAPRPVLRSPTGQRTTGRTAQKALPIPTDKVVLRAKRAWKSDDEKYKIWVIEITPRKLIYEDAANGFKLHALERNVASIYDKDPDGGTTLKGQKEEPDPNNPEAKEEKEAHFRREMPDLDQEFVDRKLAASGALSSSPAASTPGARVISPTAGPINANHPANTGPRPPSAEEAQKLRDTMGQIQSSAKYKAASKEDREKLEKLLGGRK